MQQPIQVAAGSSKNKLSQQELIRRAGREESCGMRAVEKGRGGRVLEYFISPTYSTHPLVQVNSVAS